MSDVIIVAVAFCIALSVGVLVIYCFSRCHGYMHPRPPVEDRIEMMLEAVRAAVVDMQEMLDKAERENSEAKVGWMRHMLEYFQRLESLVSSPSLTRQDLVDFAREAANFQREKRIKGPFAAFYADALAKLMEERDAK